MRRVKFGRWLAGGLVCAGGALVARSTEPPVAPAPRSAEVKPAFAALPPVPPPAGAAPSAPSAPRVSPALVPAAAQPPRELPAIPAVPVVPAQPGGAPAQPPVVKPPSSQPKDDDLKPDTTGQPIDRILNQMVPGGAGAYTGEKGKPQEYLHFPTPGFSGRSGVLPRSGSNEEYETVEDRWRIGLPEYDRYGLGHPRVNDYPWQPGQLFDPFRQNVIKGDYPIFGQHTFFNFTALNSTLFEGRMIPTATTPFESTQRPFTNEFFGRPGQFVFSNLTSLTFDLFHGDASFKPNDWRVLVQPAFNANALSVEELAVVNPDVRKGTVRNRSFGAFQQWFAEYKLADLSDQYDFVSVRAGSQPFTSDFRGFIFSDINRGVRLFGNLDGNRTQFNLAYFRQLEKDTNSGLNGFRDRSQDVVVANIYRQDFIFPGFTASASYHFNNDDPAFLFDRNGFLVRPDPAGVFTPHRVTAHYFGLAGDGHIDRYNISTALYWVVGRDSRNPIAAQPTSISGKMAALELSYDRDWARFRFSGLYQSGDGNAQDGHATGFDGILDQQNFGGDFSFFRRNRIPLFGVGLTNDQSQFVNLRSSRIQGQSNFVNPGLWLVGGGFDLDITPRLRSINNANALFFDKTNVLETFIYQKVTNRFLGVDLSTGLEWRPRLNNQMIMMTGLSALVPGGGFRQLYNNKDGKVPTLFSGFTELIFQF